MPTQNRLHLNWDLESQTERRDFAEDYIKAFNSLSDAELLTISNYILWGKDALTGKNGRQSGLQLPTRGKTWDAPDAKLESLDALMESPTFNESDLQAPHEAQFKSPKYKLERSTIRSEAPPAILKDFETLWRRIDTTDYIVASYELDHGRRTAPIRDSLRATFDDAEQLILEERAAHLNAQTYVKLKHELVELRREQYTLRDSYKPPVESRHQHTQWALPIDSELIWGEDIEVRPVIFWKDEPLWTALFTRDSNGVLQLPSPNCLRADLAQQLTARLWSGAPKRFKFDFEDINQLALLAEALPDIQNTIAEAGAIQPTIQHLIDMWDLLRELAHLSPIHSRLLDLKIERRSNDFIVRALKSEFNTSYTLNYISTLYRKNVLQQIADTAHNLRETLENLFFEENFKTCIDCGRTLLRDTTNFMHKSKNKDGFDCRCKNCAKILRDKRKQKK